MTICQPYPRTFKKINRKNWNVMSRHKAEDTVKAFLIIHDDKVREKDIYELHNVKFTLERDCSDIPIELVAKLQRLQRNPNLDLKTRSFARVAYIDFVELLNAKQERETLEEVNPAYLRYKEMEEDLLKGENAGRYVLLVEEKDPVFGDSLGELLNLAAKDVDSTLENTILRRIEADVPIVDRLLF